MAFDTLSVSVAGAVQTTNGAASITAATTHTQAAATVLVSTVNRVDTSTAPAAGSVVGDGVALPASSPGFIIVHNNTNNIVQVYGKNGGSDTINGIAGSTGVSIPPNDVALFVCAVAGAWAFEAGVGSAGNIAVELAVDGISAAGSNQGTATVLVADFNRITTVAASTGVALPAAKKGMDMLLVNHGANQLQVYGNGSDTIDDVAGSTGVPMMVNSEVLFVAYADGAWYTEGLATGWAPGGLQTLMFKDGISAAGTGQSNATPLTAMINNVSTVGAGTGVNLPSSTNGAGLSIQIQNNGANPLQVYPAQGAADTINGIAATIGVTLFQGAVATFNCTTAGAWTVQPATTKMAGFNTNTATAGTTLTAANVTGGAASVDLAMTGTLGASVNAQLPTVAAMTALMHGVAVGSSFRLRIINESSANFVWTVTTNTGWTLTGTMTIAQSTWREFVVTLTSLSAATLQSVATGTFS